MALCGPGHIRVCSRLCYRSSEIGAQKSILPASNSTYSDTLLLLYKATDRPIFIDLLLFFYSVTVVRVRYCISCYIPFFSHTINISNDQALILDIIGRRTTTNIIQFTKGQSIMKHTVTPKHTHNQALSDIHTHS